MKVPYTAKSIRDCDCLIVAPLGDRTFNINSKIEVIILILQLVMIYIE